MAKNNEMSADRKAELNGAIVKVTNSNSKHCGKVGKVVIVHNKMVTFFCKPYQQQFRVLHTSVTIVGEVTGEDEAEFGVQVEGVPRKAQHKRLRLNVTYGKLAYSVFSRLMLAGRFADDAVTKEMWMEMVREVNEEFGWEHGTYAAEKLAEVPQEVVGDAHMVEEDSL